MYDHATPCLFELHWLPVKYRIDYKIALLTFKCLYGLAPPYLSSLIEWYKPGRQNLRSADKLLLKVKKTKSVTLGEKSFSFSSPKVWNELPMYIRCETSLDLFKSKLKTFYFKIAYDA